MRREDRFGFAGSHGGYTDLVPRRVEESVVVVTGASSGIGRATALAFARRGAAVALAARRDGPLRELVGECEAMGGRALAVATDVTDAEAVGDLARRTAETFGRLDVWVNNAGVTLFARLEEAPLDLYRRVVETNFFGYVHGARAALERFREQGSGVLVNNASLNGRVPGPYISAYVATKWALVGWSASLRQELRADEDIHVCAVLPGSIDTPFFQHAANLTGRAVKPLNPLNPPEKVAGAIVGLAERPRGEVLVGRGTRLLALQRTLLPRLADRAFAAQVERDHFADEPAPPTDGNLFEAMPLGTGATGGWNGHPTSRIALGAAAAVVPAIAGGIWLARKR